MRIQPETPEDHQRRSEFIKSLVQRGSHVDCVSSRYQRLVPKTIVQYWHNLNQLPDDIEECISSWRSWKDNGFTHHLFDANSARKFIKESFGTREEQAFDRCYHPAMQSDYFRLCFLLAKGGCYIDADDICVTSNIDWLFADGRLKLQPLCYDISSASMVNSTEFLHPDAGKPDWIFYFNNNPLIAASSHPIIERSLSLATRLLESAATDTLPEIQATTGPGNLTKTIFELGKEDSTDLADGLVVLDDWDSNAISKWPSSHREDARNWRLSNQKKFKY